MADNTEDALITEIQDSLRIAGENAPQKGYEGGEDEPYMNARQLEYFRQRLLSWRLQILKDSIASLDQLKKYDWKETDILDQGLQEMATILRLQMSDRSLNLIREIDEALTRIEEGTYGYCEETGEEIGTKRLEAHPIVTLSLEAQKCKERYEKSRY